jgi:two-component system, chemotaxis family, sensor kinase Cph1
METTQSFGTLFEHSVDPAFVLDPSEDRILAANDAGCAMLGYTREELLATPVSHIHPAELPLLQDFVQQVLADGRGSTIKLSCRTRSGRFLPAEMTLFAVDGGEQSTSSGSSSTAASTAGPSSAPTDSRHTA